MGKNIRVLPSQEQGMRVIEDEVTWDDDAGNSKRTRRETKNMYSFGPMGFKSGNIPDSAIKPAIETTQVKKPAQDRNKGDKKDPIGVLYNFDHAELAQRSVEGSHEAVEGSS